MLVVEGLPETSPDRAEERKGPKVGSPEGAIQGFLKSAGLTSIDQAEIRDTDKGQVYFAVRKLAGEATDTDILGRGCRANAIDTLALAQIHALGRLARRRWVRPLCRDSCDIGRQARLCADRQQLTLCQTAGAVIPSGHRFLAPDSFTVSGFADYERRLLEDHVVLDREKRKWRIQGDSKRLGRGKRLSSSSPTSRFWTKSWG